MSGKKATPKAEATGGERKPSEVRNNGRDMLVKSGISVALAEDVVNRLPIPLVERLSAELEGKLSKNE